MINHPEKYPEVIRFLRDHESHLAMYYASYTWNDKSPEESHQNLFNLEKVIRSAAWRKELNLSHLIQIAQWGGHPNYKRIQCPEPLPMTFYIAENEPVEWLIAEPANAICIAEGRIKGFGPTYASKLLQFAVPQVFGALDSRLVRTFGQGDKEAQRYLFLDLEVEKSGKRWMIPSGQENWPDGYEDWVWILNFIARTLNRKKIPCPHPECYALDEPRSEHRWLPADVETALFSYASEIAGRKE